MASENGKFCGQLDRSIVFGDGKNLYVLINQGSGINSVAKLSTCDGVTEECESRLVAMARLLIDASTAIDTTGKTPRELAGDVEALNSELVAVRNHIRPLSDKAELADTYEKWLLDIGRQVGCQHLDEQLSNCVISALQGDRDQDELVELRRESEWIRRKLELPDNCQFFAGDGQTVAGEMHVVCSNAHGFKTYIQAHKCNDKQGEIARITVERNALAERVNVLERERGQLAEQRDELVASLRIGAKWMEWWLTNEMCDCDGIGHICGKPQRQAELDSMRATLARVNQPAAVTEGAE